MGSTEHLREILASTSADLGDAVAAGDSTRLRVRASCARGVLDVLAAVLADDEDEQVDLVSLSTERRRDPESGRFLLSKAMQARRDGSAATS